MLAGIGAGVFANGKEAARMVKIRDHFDTKMSEADRQQMLAGWSDAVRRARGLAR